MKEMNEKELPKLRRGGLFVVALVLLIFVLLDALEFCRWVRIRAALHSLVLQDCYFLRRKSFAGEKKVEPCGSLEEWSSFPRFWN